MSKNRNRTRRIYGIILTSFIIIWIGSVSLQMLSNRHNAWIASEMILQQLEDVIEENKESYQTLLETLKEEYTLRAETVANLLEMEGRLYPTTEEYRKIAKQLRVDEIHIINTGGCIVAGTNPEYFGYSFSSGEQMGYFKPMLTGYGAEYCRRENDDVCHRLEFFRYGHDPDWHYPQPTACKNEQCQRGKSGSADADYLRNEYLSAKCHHRKNACNHAAGCIAL